MSSWASRRRREGATSPKRCCPAVKLVMGAADDVPKPTFSTSAVVVMRGWAAGAQAMSGASSSLTGNAVPAAWIAAARHHHEHLATFGHGFRRLLDPGSLTVLDVVTS